MMNNLMQISDLDCMWRSMIENYYEEQGDQIEVHESIQLIHGAITREIQDGKKGGMMQMYVVITVR